MPGEVVGRGGPAPAFPIPAFLVDDLLPTLKDTELKLALVVLRQTWGRGKPADWLSHSQLKRRTGRAGEAVSSAVDALVRRGVVEVVNERGVLLSDPASRRRERAKLLYRPGALFRAAGSAGYADAHTDAECGKAGTTDSQKGIRRSRKSVPPPEPPEAAPSSERTARIEEAKRRIRERLSAL